LKKVPLNNIELTVVVAARCSEKLITKKHL